MVAAIEPNSICFVDKKPCIGKPCGLFQTQMMKKVGDGEPSGCCCIALIPLLIMGPSQPEGPQILTPN